jgi:hypothetical protein
MIALRIGIAGWQHRHHHRLITQQSAHPCIAQFASTTDWLSSLPILQVPIG